MKKNLILVILILSLVSFIKSQEDDQQGLSEDNNLEEDNFDYDDDIDGDAYFKNSLKKYLIEKKLFESERAIPRDEMKKIFVDVVFEGEYQEGSEFMNEILELLTEYFINTYYKDRKEIKGKEIYDLIDIKAISMKFEQMIGENPYFNGNDDMEENDYDSRDDVGEPNPDV